MNDQELAELEISVLSHCGLPLPVEVEATFREIEELAACLRELAAAQGYTAAVRRGSARLQQVVNECL